MLEKILGKNWRTSLCGIILGIVSFLAFYPDALEPLPDYWEKLVKSVIAFIIGGGLVKFGFSVGDIKVTKEVVDDLKQKSSHEKF